ncbi:Methylthioribose kinase [Raoultella terrigena]|uniref:Methylthioribose kinase n=1 Tax=Raoultella terrigena TaxID=577 RepID=A0A4U9D875_RAOTE|nr:Methylthioribose kinase [Raoultella terrigena]
MASLKHRFFSQAEALLHGDIHSGSIFVAEGSFKAIDAEFGYFGPIGFDIGTAIGNLLLNYCGLPGHLGIRDAAGRARTAAERYSGAVDDLCRALPGAGGGEEPRCGAGLSRLCLGVPEKSVDGRDWLLRNRADSPQRRPVARRRYRQHWR